MLASSNNNNRVDAVKRLAPLITSERTGSAEEVYLALASFAF
jgi:hypothetical protein